MSAYIEMLPSDRVMHMLGRPVERLVTDTGDLGDLGFSLRKAFGGGKSRKGHALPPPAPTPTQPPTAGGAAPVLMPAAPPPAMPAPADQAWQQYAYPGPTYSAQPQVSDPFSAPGYSPYAAYGAGAGYDPYGQWRQPAPQAAPQAHSAAPQAQPAPQAWAPAPQAAPQASTASYAPSYAPSYEPAQQYDQSSYAEEYAYGDSSDSGDAYGYDMGDGASAFVEMSDLGCSGMIGYVADDGLGCAGMIARVADDGMGAATTRSGLALEVRRLAALERALEASDKEILLEVAKRLEKVRGRRRALRGAAGRCRCAQGLVAAKGLGDARDFPAMQRLAGELARLSTLDRALEAREREIVAGAARILGEVRARLRAARDGLKILKAKGLDVETERLRAKLGACRKSHADHMREAHGVEEQA